jgi:hypothetical protein
MSKNVIESLKKDSVDIEALMDEVAAALPCDTYQGLKSGFLLLQHYGNGEHPLPVVCLGSLRRELDLRVALCSLV